MEIKTVRLKNDSEEAIAVVNTTMLSLNMLAERGFAGITQLYDLVMICRNPSYKIGEKNLKSLQELKLLESDGQPHDTVKNVVLSAVSGEALGMKISSPLKTE